MKSRCPQKTKVCIYCEIWGSGGIESFLLNVLEHVDTSLFTIDIVVSRLESYLYYSRIEALNINLIQLSGNSRAIIKNHYQFKRLLQTNNYDVVYINVFHALSIIYAYDAVKKGITNRIVHSHNNGLRTSPSKIIKLLIHQMSKILFTRYATKLLACSKPAAVFMFPQKIPYTMIPNGIDIQRFSFNEEGRQLQRRQLNLQDKFVIGNVGRLCYQKNQIFLLMIFSELVKKRGNAVLLLIGEGEDKHKLRQVAEELKIVDRVIFYGITNSIESLFWSMDIFLFPSRFEGLGIVAIEAQAAGLPVICSTNVPREVDVTRTVEFLPINKGVDEWVDRLLSTYRRRDMLDSIRTAGYDINDVADTIVKLWLQK